MFENNNDNNVIIYMVVEFVMVKIDGIGDYGIIVYVIIIRISVEGYIIDSDFEFVVVVVGFKYFEN